MSRNRDVLNAEDQVARERFQCMTCSGVAQEHSDYCIQCEMHYFVDDRFDTEPEPACESFSSTSTGR